MKIIKKVKCNRCGSVVEDVGTCSCGNLTIAEGTVILKEGKVGIDCIDISAKLLNE